MTCNVGGVERLIRIILGIALVTAATFAGLPTSWAVGGYVIGGILLVTGAVGFCPAWKLAGINTCPTAPSSKG